MIRISETIEIAAPLAEVWAIVHDPAAVAGCVPGAELTGEIGPGQYQARISIKFGPTVAHFAGEAKVEYDEGARRVTVSGRGNDRRGMSPIQGSGVITLSGEATTSARVDGQFEIAGPLESFVDTGGAVVARILLGQFAENVGKLVQSRSAPAPAPESIVTEGAGPAAVPPPPPRPAAAAPISAGNLLGHILRDRLHALVNWVLRRK